MTPERHALVCETLARRQPDLTVMMECVHKPHNFSAVIRTCDAVGVYEAHAVAGSDGIPLISHTAQGAHKWVEVQNHADLSTGVQHLRQSGMQILAADVGEGCIDFRQADYCKPTALVLGNERDGLSLAARAEADQRITIPMQGMVESLNVSVACALILFEAQRQRLAAGLYEHSRLDADRYRSTLFEWLHPRASRHYRERGLAYPPLDEQGQIISGDAQSV